MKKKRISIVASALNEEKNILELHRQICEALLPHKIPFELVLIDNGSSDNTWNVMRTLASKDKRVRCLSLSRTFGHQEALLAGMDHARGDAVITMDSDLQHPPEVIPQMVKLWQEGNKIVFTTKAKDYKISFFRYQLTRLFYFIISKISGLKLSFGQADFRLLDRQVIKVIQSMAERPKFLRGIVDWVGFPRTSIEFTVRERHAGVSKYNFRRLLEYGLNGIFSFSMVPLKIFWMSGIIISTLCFLYAIYAITVKILSASFPSVTAPTGWTTLVVIILFLSSIQLIGIGLLGEYIGRIYHQSKGRPEYIVKEKSF
jgi:dolichol-phosphate mannosyltransferase